MEAGNKVVILVKFLSSTETISNLQTSGESKELFGGENTTGKECLHVIAVIRTVEEVLSGACEKAQRLQLKVISMLFTTAAVVVIIVYVMRRLSGGRRGGDDHLLLRVLFFRLTITSSRLAVQLWNATQML